MTIFDSLNQPVRRSPPLESHTLNSPLTELFSMIVKSAYIGPKGPLKRAKRARDTRRPLLATMQAGLSWSFDSAKRGGIGYIKNLRIVLFFHHHQEFWQLPWLSFLVYSINPFPTAMKLSIIYTLSLAVGGLCNCSVQLVSNSSQFPVPLIFHDWTRCLGLKRIEGKLSS